HTRSDRDWSSDVCSSDLMSAAGGLDPDVEALFQQFRKGDKAHARDGKYETHYDLGVAYKEMDLLAEAIEEFQQAACGPTRFIDEIGRASCRERDRYMVDV